MIVPDLAVVPITLDTTAPVITVTATSTVDPPADWTVALLSNEDIGAAHFGVIDAFGVEHSIGYLAVGYRVINISVPTVALYSPAVLIGWVEDLVGNRAEVEVPVDVVRDQPFDCVLTISHAFGVTETEAAAFDTVLTFSHGFDTVESEDHAFEVEETLGHGFDVEETLHT